MMMINVLVRITFALLIIVETCTTQMICYDWKCLKSTIQEQVAATLPGQSLSLSNVIEPGFGYDFTQQWLSSLKTYLGVYQPMLQSITMTMKNDTGSHPNEHIQIQGNLVSSERRNSTVPADCTIVQNHQSPYICMSLSFPLHEDDDPDRGGPEQLLNLPLHPLGGEVILNATRCTHEQNKSDIKFQAVQGQSQVRLNLTGCSITPHRAGPFVPWSDSSNGFCPFLVHLWNWTSSPQVPIRWDLLQRSSSSSSLIKLRVFYIPLPRVQLPWMIGTVMLEHPVIEWKFHQHQSVLRPPQPILHGDLILLIVSPRIKLTMTAQMTFHNDHLHSVCGHMLHCMYIQMKSLATDAWTNVFNFSCLNLYHFELTKVSIGKFNEQQKLDQLPPMRARGVFGGQYSGQALMRNISSGHISTVELTLSSNVTFLSLVQTLFSRTLPGLPQCIATSVIASGFKLTFSSKQRVIHFDGLVYIFRQWVGFSGHHTSAQALEIEFHSPIVVSSMKKPQLSMIYQLSSDRIKIGPTFSIQIDASTNEHEDFAVPHLQFKVTGVIGFLNTQMDMRWFRWTDSGFEFIPRDTRQELKLFEHHVVAEMTNVSVSVQTQVIHVAGELHLGSDVEQKVTRQCERLTYNVFRDIGEDSGEAKHVKWYDTQWNLDSPFRQLSTRKVWFHGNIRYDILHLHFDTTLTSVKSAEFKAQVRFRVQIFGREKEVEVPVIFDTAHAETSLASAMVLYSQAYSFLAYIFTRNQKSTRRPLNLHFQQSKTPEAAVPNCKLWQRYPAIEKYMNPKALYCAVKMKNYLGNPKKQDSRKCTQEHKSTDWLSYEIFCPDSSTSRSSSPNSKHKVECHEDLKKQDWLANEIFCQHRALRTLLQHEPSSSKQYHIDCAKVFPPASMKIFQSRITLTDEHLYCQLQQELHQDFSTEEPMCEFKNTEDFVSHDSPFYCPLSS